MTATSLVCGSKKSKKGFRGVIKRTNYIAKLESDLKDGRTGCAENKKIDCCILRNPWTAELHLITGELIAV
jgi:hypothetical protein